MVGSEIAGGQHQHARHQAEQLAVGGDEAGAFEREENPPRCRARQVGSLGEVAQCHGLSAAAEHLQHAQAAIEAFDEIGRAAVVCVPHALKLRHRCLHNPLA